MLEITPRLFTRYQVVIAGIPIAGRRYRWLSIITTNIVYETLSVRKPNLLVGPNPTPLQGSRTNIPSVRDLRYILAAAVCLYLTFYWDEARFFFFLKIVFLPSDGTAISTRTSSGMVSGSDCRVVGALSG